jgi:WD40 repeat protein
VAVARLRGGRAGGVHAEHGSVHRHAPDGRAAGRQGVQPHRYPARPLRAGFSALPKVSTGSISGTNGVLAAAAEDANYSACDCYDLRIFNLSRGHVTASAAVSDMGGDQIDISNDNRLLAAAGPGDNGLTLWTVSAPRRPVFAASVATVPDLEGITISTDDKRLADWDNGTLQLWDITNPADPALLASVSFSTQPDATGITSDIDNATFAPSGPELAVALSNTVTLVNTDPAALAEQYCAETGGTITRAEWSRHASNVPYQNPCPGG